MPYIDIKPEHISAGKRHDPENCPLALAFKDHYKDRYKAIAVMGDKIVYTRLNGTTFETPLAPDIQEQVKQFDETGKMDPTTLVQRSGSDLQGIPSVYTRS